MRIPCAPSLFIPMATTNGPTKLDSPAPRLIIVIVAPLYVGSREGTNAVNGAKPAINAPYKAPPTIIIAAKLPLKNGGAKAISRRIDPQPNPPNIWTALPQPILSPTIPPDDIKEYIYKEYQCPYLKPLFG